MPGKVSSNGCRCSPARVIFGLRKRSLSSRIALTQSLGGKAPVIHAWLLPTFYKLDTIVPSPNFPTNHPHKTAPDLNAKPLQTQKNTPLHQNLQQNSFY